MANNLLALNFSIGGKATTVNRPTIPTIATFGENLLG
jgi:hypothetical protein